MRTLHRLGTLSAPLALALTLSAAGCASGQAPKPPAELAAQAKTPQPPAKTGAEPVPAQPITPTAQGKPGEAPDKAAERGPELSVGQLVEAGNRLGAKLFGGASAKTTDNLVLSPYSISSVVVLLDAGAAGKTEKEIAAALGLDKGYDPASLHAAAAKLRARLGIRPPFELGLDLAKDVKDGGLEVVAVAPGSPAEQAALKPGDVLLKVNGQPVKGKAELDAALTGVGPTVTLDLKGKEGTRSVVVVLPTEQIAKGAGPSPYDYELLSATGLWGQADLRYEDPFLKLAGKFYPPGLQRLDFTKQPGPCREAINHWVEEHTQGGVKDLLSPADVKAPTRLVVANALTFQARWRWKFDPKKTAEEAFKTSPTSAVPVPFMNQTQRFGLLVGKGFKAVDLPYEGQSASLVVVVPDDIDGLPALASLLQKSPEVLLRQPFDTGKLVHIALPKFSIRNRIDLVPALGELMPSAFSPQDADFSGITKDAKDKAGLYVSTMVHEAFIDVDEAGTRAGAATAGGVSVFSEPVTVKADRPFLFILKENRTGAALFVGHYTGPQKSAGAAKVGGGS
jgi:serine protease inhibitor